MDFNQRYNKKSGNKNWELGKESLFDNPTPRLPVCLVLDTSYSMHGRPINELNEGIYKFYDHLKKDERLKLCSEIAIVTFGHNGVTKILDFDSVERQQIPTLKSEGYTPIGEAVNLALDTLYDRKKEYSNAGISYYRPWMVLMTDGLPTDEYTNAALRSTNLVNNDKLIIFPVGIGDDYDMDVLKEFSPKVVPHRLQDYNFYKYFKSLADNMRIVSNSCHTDDPMDILNLAMRNSYDTLGDLIESLEK